jgi:anaerobic magnesium-protoporphyrin IX monomethyl ester cyclase
MAHVTLIRAPYVTSAHTFSALVDPPLGPAYIAAALESAGNEVTLIDSLGLAPDKRHPTAYPSLVAHGLTNDEIVARIPQHTAGIGLSVMFSLQWPHAEALLHAIHARFPDKPVFLGGEHGTATWQYLLSRCPELTACVLGEGEDAAIELAEWLDGKRELDSIAGLAIRTAEGPQKTAGRARIRNPENLPRPAWHHVPLEMYMTCGLGQGLYRGRTLPVLATRGCPYQCTFCSSPGMWTTRYVLRPVTDVVDEIEDYVRQYNITNVDFADLTAFVKRQWILDLCREIERRKLHITYQVPVGTRSEVLDREVLEALYRTGCRNICYAPESGSAETLERVKKRVRLDKMIESMRAAIEVGMTLRVNLIIGFPFEKRSGVWQTFQFALKLARVGVEDISFYPFTPYPGSEIYEDLRREGALPEMSNDYFASLTFMDLSLGPMQGICKSMGARELAVYRTAGMAIANAAAYATHPVRVLRTLRNLMRGIYATSVERRLGTILRRRIGVRASRLLGVGLSDVQVG